MDYQLVSILAQTATGVATLAVAAFLSFQLRLQRKESVASAQSEPVSYTHLTLPTNREV